MSVIIRVCSSMKLHMSVEVFFRDERLFASSAKTTGQNLAVGQLMLGKNCKLDSLSFVELINQNLVYC